MTPANPFERLVEDWLAVAAGPMDVPGHLHAAVVEQARRTRQRRAGLGFPRSRTKVDAARLAIDLAAVVVLAIATVNVLPPLTPGGELAPSSRSAPPSPSAGIATAPAPPSPSAGIATLAPSRVSPGVRPIWGDYILGRHSMTVDGITFSFATEAAGWEPYDGFQISKSFVGGQSAEAVLFWAGYPNSLRAFSCFDLREPTLRSAYDIVDAVSETRGLVVIAGPSKLTIGDRSAWRVIATIRDDEGCDPGYIYNWKVSGGAFWTSTQPGDRITVWAMEVEGGILVIGGLLSNLEAVPEIEAIVSSMRFD